MGTLMSCDITVLRYFRVRLRGWCVSQKFVPANDVPHSIKQQLYPTDHPIYKEINIPVEVQPFGSLDSRTTTLDKRQLPLDHISTRFTVFQYEESRLTGCYAVLKSTAKNAA